MIFKPKNIYIALISTAVMAGSASANCVLDKYDASWVGDITFHCDQSTNLTQNQIAFTLSNGVKVHSAWGLEGAPVAVTAQGGLQVGQKYWPKEDYTLPANKKVTIQFSPSSDKFELTNFHIGTAPVTQGTITFKQDGKSDTIPDAAVITLTPISGKNAGYQFKWADVKSGKASAISAGQYQISAIYDRQQITPIPSEITVKAGESYRISLNYQQYKGAFNFKTTYARPAGASDINISIKDTTSGSVNQVSLPWSEAAAMLKNIEPNHTYQFSASDIYAANNHYQFSLNPSSVTPSTDKDGYNIALNVKSTPVVSYTAKFTISGLPEGTKSTVTLKNAQGVTVASKAETDGSETYKLPAGQYSLTAQSITKDGYQYQYNNGQAKTISISKDQSNRFAIAFAKQKIGGLVAGWPDYIAMGAVTDGAGSQEISGRKVDAIFKYAGSGGNGDPGVITLPIFTEETMNVANLAAQNNQHAVKPVMVVYTAQMSGGAAFTDFSDANNVLTKHFINLMLYAKMLETAKAKGDNVGSIILNPDLFGELQQNHLYNAATHQVGGMSKIAVNEALQKAYWFVNTPHDWTLKPNYGAAFTVKNETPLRVFQDAVAGKYKKYNIYSTWGIKTQWESQSSLILDKAPSNLHANIPNFEESFNGWVQATNWAVQSSAPDVTFGWQENVWNVGSANWVHKDYTTDEIKTNISDPTHKILHEIGVFDGQYKPDFLVFDKYEMDGNAAKGVGYLWNARDWDHYMTYVAQLSQGFDNIPVMLWQIPGGHLQTTAETDNTSGIYSTAPDYFFGDKTLETRPDLGNVKSDILNATLPGGGIYSSSTVGSYLTQDNYDWQQSNLEKAKNSNVFAILWGGGNTTSVGTFPNKGDNDKWLAAKVNAYQKSPTYL